MTKRITAYLVAAVYAMATMTAVVMTIGCKNGPSALTIITNIETELPVALTTASQLASYSGDPALAAAFQVAANAVQTDEATVAAATAAYKANPGASNLQKVMVIVSAIAGTLNAQVLAANGVPAAKGNLALLWLTGLASVFNGFVMALSTAGATTVAMAVPYSAVASLIPREQKQRVAADYGTTLEALGL